MALTILSPLWAQVAVSSKSNVSCKKYNIPQKSAHLDHHSNWHGRTNRNKTDRMFILGNAVSFCGGCGGRSWSNLPLIINSWVGSINHGTVLMSLVPVGRPIFLGAAQIRSTGQKEDYLLLLISLLSHHQVNLSCCCRCCWFLGDVRHLSPYTEQPPGCWSLPVFITGNGTTPTAEACSLKDQTTTVFSGPQMWLHSVIVTIQSKLM